MKSVFINAVTTILIICSVSHAFGQTDTTQNDLMNMLDSGTNKHIKQYTIATFKSTHLINGQTIENLGMGVLDFRISHRFGQLNEGASNFFGLDDATTRLGLDYGITSWLMVGLGHSTYQKEDDGFLKVKLLRQRDNGGMPISVGYLASMSVQTMPAPQLPQGETYYYSNRLFYVHQLFIARKFNEWLSLQLMPTVVHYNLAAATNQPNNVYSAGIGGRIKLTHRIALTGEYYYNINPLAGFHNALSFGIDIETGGHVFQLMLTNATAMTERAFIGQTAGDWSKGDIHFGFNISRVFTVVRPKEFKGQNNHIW